MRMLALVLVLLLGAQSAIAVEPVPTPRKIFFATGSTRGTAGGHVQRGARDLYSVTAGAGQLMTITLTAPDDNAVFQVYEPDTSVVRDSGGLLQFKGTPLPGAGAPEDTTRWTGRLPRAGTYLVVVGSTRGNARYSMDVKIE
jgi:hypothetical protein